jgi:hypothetical protein
MRSLPCGLAAALTALCFLLPVPAAALTLELAGQDHAAEIGKDLVLELILAGDDAPRDAGAVTITF